MSWLINVLCFGMVASTISRAGDSIDKNSLSAKSTGTINFQHWLDKHVKPLKRFSEKRHTEEKNKKNSEEINDDPLKNLPDTDENLGAHDMTSPKIENSSEVVWIDPFPEYKKSMIEETLNNFIDSSIPLEEVLHQINELPYFADMWLKYVTEHPFLHQEDIRPLLDKEKLRLDPKNFAEDFKDSCEKILAPNKDAKFYQNLLSVEKKIRLLKSIDAREDFNHILTYIAAGASFENDSPDDSTLTPADVARQQGQQVLAIALSKKEYWFLFDLQLLEQHVQKIIQQEKYVLTQIEIDKAALRERMAELVHGSRKTHKRPGNKRASMPPLQRVRGSKNSKKDEISEPPIKKVPSTRVLVQPKKNTVHKTRSTKNFHAHSSVKTPEDSIYMNPYLRKIKEFPARKKDKEFPRRKNDRASKTYRFSRNATHYKNRRRSNSNP